MKNITLRADGLYMARKQINGKRVTFYGHSETECYNKLKQTKNIIKKLNKKQESNYKLHEWLDNWFITYKEPFISMASAGTIKNVILQIKIKFENINLNNLTTQSIQKFLNDIPKSRKKEFITLYFNASMQKAEDLSIINKNPFRAVIKETKLNNIRKGYTIQEQTKILTAIKNTDIEPVILFYLATGIRKNELTTFNIEKDIDYSNLIIKIKSEKKRNKTNQYRTIDITKEILNLIINNKNSFLLKPEYIYKQLKDILHQLKIKSGLHLLRHTFATNHFYLGTPVKIISSWLGHEKIELTQNIYTHIDRTINKKDIIKLYNNLLYTNYTTFTPLLEGEKEKTQSNTF